MSTFKIHTENTAAAPVNQVLSQVKESLGFIPNVFAVAAESEPALMAFVDLNNHLANSTLTPTERELVQIATSVENSCTYCVAGHTAFAAMQEVATEIVEAARAGGPIPDPRLNALHQLTLTLIRQKGTVDPSVIDAFFAAGYSRAQLLEVIVGICAKVFSNLANAAVGFPLDDQFASYSWKPLTTTTASNVL